MSRAFIVGVLQNETGLTGVDAKRAAAVLIDAIVREMKRNRKFSLPKFGTFTVRRMKARKALNPKTSRPARPYASSLPLFRGRRYEQLGRRLEALSPIAGSDRCRSSSGAGEIGRTTRADQAEETHCVDLLGHGRMDNCHVGGLGMAMTEERLSQLLVDLDAHGGMLSRWKLIDLGYLESELQMAAQQGKIHITGRGIYASIFLIGYPT
jgi:DNA-binding protein HU-beta